MSFKSQDPIWLHWQLASKMNVRPKRVRCLYCMSKVMRMSAERCKRHTFKCPGSPAEIKDFFRAIVEAKMKKSSVQKEVSEKQQSSNVDEVVPMDQQSASESPMEPLCVLVSGDDADSVGVDSGVDTLPSCSSVKHQKQQQQEQQQQQQQQQQAVDTAEEPQFDLNTRAGLLSDLFARAVVSGDVSLSWIDNHYLKLFLHTLDPKFDLPSAEQITDIVLENIHDQCQREIMGKVIKTDNVSIVLYEEFGSESRSKSKMVVMLSSPENLWYKTKEIGPATDDPRILRGYLERVVNNIGILKVSSVMTNNPKMTKLAIEDICKQFPHIIPLKCPFRALCDLFADVCRLNSLHVLLTSAISVVRELGASEVLSEKYVELWSQFVEECVTVGVAKEKIGCLRLCRDSWWHFVMDLMAKLLTSKLVLCKLASERDSLFTRESRNVVDDDAFWKNIELAVNLLKPLVNAIMSLENNSVMISELTVLMSSVEEVFLDVNLKKFTFTRLERRKAKACYRNRLANKFLTKYHRLANFLDPKYRGRAVNIDINEPALKSVLRTLEQYGNALGLFNNSVDMQSASDCLASFRRHDRLFGLPLLECQSGATYWANLQSYDSCRVLAIIAMKILAIPASSASTHRSLSKARITPPDVDWLSPAKLKRLQMVRWALSKHIEETNGILAESQIDYQPCNDEKWALSEDRLMANVTLLDDAVISHMREPFSDEELKQRGEANDQDCFLVCNTF